MTTNEIVETRNGRVKPTSISIQRRTTSSK
jgi:hypothetical protein